MLLIDYPSIRREDFTYYDRSSTWNLLHAYIDARSQILTNEYPGDGLQAISRLQSQCAKLTFSDKIRYNTLFQQVIQK